MKVTFDVEDEADIGRAIHYLMLWEDALRISQDPELADKVDALIVSHAALASDDTVDAPQIRPEASPAKPKKRRSAPEVKILDVRRIATPPEDLRKAVVKRGIVFASMLVAQHGVTHVGELTDNQLRAALNAPA
jgi:hypothetical protein